MVRAVFALVVTPVVIGVLFVVLRAAWVWDDNITTGVSEPWGPYLLPYWHSGLHIGVAVGALLALILLLTPTQTQPGDTNELQEGTA